MKKIKKRIIWAIAIIAVACLTLILLCDLIIVNNAIGKLFSDVEQVAPTEYGLLLGTTPQTRIGRRQNQFFKFRIDAAEELYKTGKIKKILISGDENSLAQIERHFYEVVAEGVVLFTVENLEHSRGRIALDIAAELVYFIKKDEWVHRTCL